jgi:uroporphyrinogen decarboxylase
MRQAGRYLPEYRALKEVHGFLNMVRTPELATEVTLQPLQRFAFDAAILFSDILVIPEALGQGYRFKDGGGIEMERALLTQSDIDGLAVGAVEERLDYVPAALRLLRQQLGDKRALLGFCGSPWTLAAYMIEGGGSETFPRLLTLAHTRPEVLSLLLEKLTDALATYLRMQAKSGVDAVQIFDSWAGLCPGARYQDWSLRWIRELVTRVGSEVPVILFARGAGAHLDALAATGVPVLAADTSMDLPTAARRIPTVAWQGNLDPTVMELSPEIAAATTRDLLASMRGRPGYIVNLGHGIRPAARLESVAASVEAVVASAAS